MKTIEKLVNQFDWNDFNLEQLKDFVAKCEQKFNLNGSSFGGASTIKNVIFTSNGHEGVSYIIQHKSDNKSLDY